MKSLKNNTHVPNSYTNNGITNTTKIDVADGFSFFVNAVPILAETKRH